MLATVGKGRGSDQNSEEQIWMAGSCGQVGRDTVLGYLIQKIRAIIISSLQNCSGNCMRNYIKCLEQCQPQSGAPKMLAVTIPRTMHK